MFGPWLNRRWLCFSSVHLEEWVIFLAPHFRQTDGFSFGKLVYIRFFYYSSWRFFNSHSFECKTSVDCRENFTLGARGLFFPFFLFLSDAMRRGKKNLWSHELRMLFLTSELANKAEITILSAWDTTRAWVPGRGIMGRNIEVYKTGYNTWLSSRLQNQPRSFCFVLFRFV